MPDPRTGMTDQEQLLGKIRANDINEREELIWDEHSRFDVLWVPRSGNYDVAALFSKSSANGFATVFKQGSAQWLADSEGFSDVLHASWAKDVEGPFGSFNFSLRPRDPGMPEYMDILRPGDLVFIYASSNSTMNEDPFSGTLLTYGIISRPNRSTNSEGGPDVETTSVSGADLGVIFSKTATVFDQAFSEIENTAFTDKWFDRLFSEQDAGSPLEHILLLLDLVYNTKATGSKVVAAQWQLKTTSDIDDPGTPLASLIDVTTFTQNVMFGYTLPEVFAIAQSGNVYNLLTSYANKLVNEFFFDVRDYDQGSEDVTNTLANFARGVLTDSDATKQIAAHSKMRDGSVFASAAVAFSEPDGSKAPIMAMVLRQRPYDRDSFNMLPVNEVFGSEVFSDDLGFSDHDVSNFFRVRFPSMPNEYQELIYGVHLNMQSVHRFGIRRMESETRYNFGSSSASAAYGKGDSRPQDFSDIFDWYCGLLAVWNAANEELLSGSLSMRFRPEIRCGTRLRYYRKGTAYDLYVQGVNHSFSVEAGASSTTLTLTRGIAVEDEGRLVNNLFWTATGSGIPPEVDPYGRFTAAGFDFKVGAVRVINQQKDA